MEWQLWRRQTSKLADHEGYRKSPWWGRPVGAIAPIRAADFYAIIKQSLLCDLDGEYEAVQVYLLPFIILYIHENYK